MQRNSFRHENITYTYFDEWLVVKVRKHTASFRLPPSLRFFLLFIFFSFSFGLCMHYKIYEAVFVYFRTFMCLRVFIYEKFLDSHVVIWMLQFTDIVSSDVAIVEAIERCKSQHGKNETNKRKKTATAKAVVVKTTISTASAAATMATMKTTTPTNDEWKIHAKSEGER